MERKQIINQIKPQLKEILSDFEEVLKNRGIPGVGGAGLRLVEFTFADSVENAPKIVIENPETGVIVEEDFAPENAVPCQYTCWQVGSSTRCGYICNF